MVSRKEHKEEMFLQEYLHGIDGYESEELQKELIQQYGKDIVETKNETRPTKGFLGALKRSFGLGGYETVETPITLAEKVQDMDDDELRDFGEEFAQQKLEQLLRARGEKFQKGVNNQLNRAILPSRYDKPEVDIDFWDIAVALCDESVKFRYAKEYGNKHNEDIRGAIGGHLWKHHPDFYKKYGIDRDNGYQQSVIEGLIFVAQKCDESERRAVRSWIEQGRGDPLPFFMEESKRQWEQEWELENSSENEKVAEPQEQARKKKGLGLEKRLKQNSSYEPADGAANGLNITISAAARKNKQAE